MNAIKIYRDKNKLSQTELATALQCYQMRVSRYEKQLESGRGLKPEVAREISEKLGIPRDHLLYPSEAAA